MGCSGAIPLKSKLCVMSGVKPTGIVFQSASDGATCEAVVGGLDAMFTELEEISETPILLVLDWRKEVVDMLDVRDSGTSGVEAKSLPLELDSGLSNDDIRANAVLASLACIVVNGIFTECRSSAFCRRT